MANLSDVIVPSTAEDAVAAFGDGSNVTVLAGGTIVMPDLKLGRRRPEVHARVINTPRKPAVIRRMPTR